MKGIDAGSMDRIIYVQKPIFDVSASGNKQISEWQNVTEEPLAAMRMEVRGKEEAKPGIFNVTQDFQYTIHYQSGIEENFRILDIEEEKFYDIRFIEQIGRRQGLRLHSQYNRKLVSYG